MGDDIVYDNADEDEVIENAREADIESMDGVNVSAEEGTTKA